ncbi:MAG: META domain-containing protein [Chloroflexota bacterium]
MKKQILAFALAAIVLTLTACTGTGVPLADLNGTSWTLTRLNGQPVLDGTQPSLAFADGQASGNASCNGFGGEYTLNGDELTFGALMSTLMACFPEEVMDQESAYFAALAATASFQLEGEMLTLIDEEGTSLAEFMRMP